MGLFDRFSKKDKASSEEPQKEQISVDDWF